MSIEDIKKAIRDKTSVFESACDMTRVQFNAWDELISEMVESGHDEVVIWRHIALKLQCTVSALLIESMTEIVLLNPDEYANEIMVEVTKQKGNP